MLTTLNEIRYRGIKLEVWNHQRILSESRINDIVSYIDTSHRLDGIWRTHHWKLSCCQTPDNTLYIIDGQHRYQAYLILEREKQEREKVRECGNEPTLPDLYVSVERVESEADIRQSFIMANKSIPVDTVWLECDISSQQKSYVSNGVSRFVKKYKSMFVNSSNPRSPHLLEHELHDMLISYMFQSGDDVVSSLESFNLFCKENLSMLSVLLESAKQKANKNKCYVGCFRGKKNTSFREMYVRFLKREMERYNDVKTEEKRDENKENRSDVKTEEKIGERSDEKRGVHTEEKKDDQREKKYKKQKIRYIKKIITIILDYNHL